MPFSFRDKGTLEAQQKGWDEGMFVANFVRRNNLLTTWKSC